MLSIGLVSAGQEQYYLDLSREDYYTESGEPEGQWFGTGAEALGLKGIVEKEYLSKLIRGFDPDGAKLVRNAGSKSRRAGLDLTFSAPKSVSVFWSQASAKVRRGAEEAHTAAVKAALEYVENSAAFIRYGLDGVHRKKAGLVVATFEHSSARLADKTLKAPDPHLHTHSLVINVGIAEDGKTTTIDSRELYRHKMAAGVVYRAELFRQMEQRFGISAKREGRFCELEGIPKELLDEFSKRRKAIEEYLSEKGVSGPSASDGATLKTRTVKPRVDREMFFEEWKRIGERFGFEVNDEFLARAVAAKPERDEEALVRGGIKRAIQKVTEQHSHFAERELVRALADDLEDKGVGAAAILSGAKEALESPEIVKVGEATGEIRFSTEEMLHLERALLREAAALSRRQHAVQPKTLVEVLRSRKTITKEQLVALHHMTEHKALSLVRGLAGTGKTYIMEAAREAWEKEDYTVLGCTLAATAAKRLQEDSGIQSETLHKMLWRIEEGYLKLDEKSIVVVDEAAMVGTRQLQTLIRAVGEAQAKLVLVGDDRQLQAIDAGAPFASMAKRFGASELNDIRRQRKEWARDAVVEFSRGEAKKALNRFRERGLVSLLDSKREAIAKLVRDYEKAVGLSGFKETMVLAGTRVEARKLNQEIQLRRKANSELGDRVFAGEVAFYVGDRVLFRKNSKRQGVLNGDRGEVVAVRENEMTVRLDDGNRVTIDVRDHELVAPHLGYAATTHSMQGATVDRCLVLCGGSMQDREATYVQASRSREETRIYTDRISAGEEFEDMVRAMERTRAKDLALDVSKIEQTSGDRQELWM